MCPWRRVPLLQNWPLTHFERWEFVFVKCSCHFIHCNSVPLNGMANLDWCSNPSHTVCLNNCLLLLQVILWLQAVVV
uniref:Uncharacterized protein n=1 Tax=Anguilla anguilla TaxID=7936 RepID=A0A0E9WSQ8_ANGAN